MEQWMLRVHYTTPNGTMKNKEIVGIDTYTQALTKKLDVVQHGFRDDKACAPRFMVFVTPGAIKLIEVIGYDIDD